MRYITWLIALFGGLTLLASPAPAHAQNPTIALNQTVWGCITDSNPTDDYTFTGTVGDEITVLQVALYDQQLFDPYVYIYSSTGTLLASNDDIIFAIDLDAAIVGFDLPYTGTYTIRASRYATTAGAYAMTVVAGAPSVVTYQIPAASPCTRPFDVGDLGIVPPPQPRQGPVLGLRGDTRSSNAGSRIPAGTAVIGTLTTLNGAEVNVRLGPGISYGRIGTIGRGQAFPLIGQSPGWYIIDYFGVQGYVSAEWASVTYSR